MGPKPLGPPLGPRLGLGGGSKGFGAGGVGGRGTGPRDGANFATCVVFLTFLTRTKRRKMIFFERYPVGWGGTRAREGGFMGFGSGGVGGRHGPQGRSKFRNLRCIVDVGADPIAAAIARGGQNGLLRGDMSREATRCNNYQR